MSLFSWCQSVIVGLSGNVADVDSSNQLKVVTPPPVAPAGTDPISESFLNSSNADIDEPYVVTSGKTLTIQSFRSGAAGNGAICSAYEADDGSTPNNLNKPIAIAFVTPGNDSQSLSADVVGNGTRAVILRREPEGGGGARQMYIAISGFEQ